MPAEFIIINFSMELQSGFMADFRREGMFAINLIICDDDPQLLKDTAHQVRQWADQRRLPVQIRTCQDGGQLRDSLLRKRADIILLDIMMPGQTGMDAAREIRKTDSCVKIIFFTSSPEYAVESYEVKASGYLLKPVLDGKLCAVLDDCAESMRLEPESITLRTACGYQNIYIRTIECVEAQNKRVVFTLTDGSHRESADTLSHYGQRLTCEKGFFKCHRSYIVSIAAVDRFTTAEIQTKSGMRVPIARGTRKAFQKAYFAYMSKKDAAGND